MLLAIGCLFLESSALCHQRSVMGVAADSAVKRIQDSVFASGRQKYSHFLAEGRLMLRPQRYRRSRRDNYRAAKVVVTDFASRR